MSVTARILTPKTFIRGALTALSIASIGVAQAEQYRAPAHNFYQNNWMAN
jgi:hypothetical protein